MKRKTGILAATVSLAALLGVGLAAPAYADGVSSSTPAIPGPGGPTSSALTVSPESASGPIGRSAALGVSPGGCSDQTDHAHKSGSESSVHGRTTCNFPVTSASVTTYLYNQQWFGWNLLNSGTSKTTGKNTSNDAHPHYPCSTSNVNSFYGASAHSSVEGGRTYSASTSSPVQKFGC